MRKIVLFIAIIFAIACSTLKAQNDTVSSQHYEHLSVLEIQDGQIINYCIDESFLGVIIHAEPNCPPEELE